jgi:hypothetical protein
MTGGSNFAMNASRCVDRTGEAFLLRLHVNAVALGRDRGRTFKRNQPTETTVDPTGRRSSLDAIHHRR